MKPSERQRIAADQRRRAEVEQRFAAARKGESLRETIEKASSAAAHASRPPKTREPLEVRAQRAASELANARRRISAEDLAAMNHVYLTRGWPAVRKALLDARIVSAEALSLADGIVQRSGLEGLGAAIEARIQSEDTAALQASAEQEAVGALSNLTPAQWAEAERINAAGGPQAVFAAAQSIGLSPAAATVVARTVESHGVSGMRQGVAERVQREAAEAESREASERAVQEWTAQEGDSRRARAVKEGSPVAAMMRDPAFHAAAAGMAAKLEAAGVKREPRQSAAAFVLETLDRLDSGRVINDTRKPFDPAWSEAKQLETVTKLLGSDSPEAVRKFLGAFETARTGHVLVDRLAAADEKRPAAPKHGTNPLRETIEAAAAKHGTKERPVGVGNSLGATIAIAAGLKPDRDVVLSTRYAERDAERAAERLEPKPDTSLRGTIAAAIAAEEDEPENTGGSTDE